MSAGRALGWFMLVAVVSAAGPGVVVPTVPGSAGQATTETVGTADATGAVDARATAQDQPAADGTATRVRVYANGSARWTVRIRTRLSNDSEVEAYRRFQDRFRNDTARYLSPFRQRIRGTVANAENATTRSMTATDFAASTSVRQLPRRFGVVTYSFTWRGFARPTADGVAAGDVFVGGFLLSPGDTLTLVAPAGYTVARAEPAPDRSDDGRLTWEGPRSFADRRPEAAFVPGATDGGAAGDGAVNDADGADGVPWYYPVGGLALLAGALLAAGLAYRRRGASEPEATAGGDAGAGSAVPDEPLSDADRVRKRLAEADGRMRQQQVAEAFGWSASKTSRTLSDMEDEGVIERVRIGRENVVRLTDEE